MTTTQSRIETLPQWSDRRILDRVRSYQPDPSKWGTFQQAVVAEAVRRGIAQ